MTVFLRCVAFLTCLLIALLGLVSANAQEIALPEPPDVSWLYGTFTAQAADGKLLAEITQTATIGASVLVVTVKGCGVHESKPCWIIRYSVDLARSKFRDCKDDNGVDIAHHRVRRDGTFRLACTFFNSSVYSEILAPSLPHDQSVGALTMFPLYFPTAKATHDAIAQADILFKYFASAHPNASETSWASSNFTLYHAEDPPDYRSVRVTMSRSVLGIYTDDCEYRENGNVRACESNRGNYDMTRVSAKSCKVIDEHIALVAGEIQCEYHSTIMGQPVTYPISLSLTSTATAIAVLPKLKDLIVKYQTP